MVTQPSEGVAESQAHTALCALLFFLFPQVLHEPLIDEDPVFIATCTERELRKRKKRKFSLWVRQCSSTGFIIQVSRALRRGDERCQKWGLRGICRPWGDPEPSQLTLFPLSSHSAPELQQRAVCLTLPPVGKLVLGEDTAMIDSTPVM